MIIATPYEESGPATTDLRVFLDRKVEEYNRSSFIAGDPICIPHTYRKKQDIEIAGFFTAIFSWGNRTSIINKTQELMQYMDHSPHQFVLQHTDKDLKRLLGFRHRTFNPTDLLYFIEFFRQHYRVYDSLEAAFLLAGEAGEYDAGTALSAFHHYFFSLDTPPPRTRKHIASPEKKSSCKRLNMFLRWMVRKDSKGVDFGLWERIPMSALVCPLDVHVARVARRFGLLTREATDWQAALELTESLSLLDPEDPTKYDFALFGLGAIEKF
jgi:uncharacterized protein (TIGR02757 family)